MASRIDQGELQRIDREVRTQHLKYQLLHSAGGDVASRPWGDCPDDMEEEFWQCISQCPNEDDTLESPRRPR